MPSLTKIQTGFLDPQGAFELDPGTASAPGLFFSGNTSTGMFSPSSGVLGFSTGSTQNALSILADGNVGIGTDNPTTKLHLSSGGATQLTISNTSTSMSDGATIGTIDFSAGSSNTVNARVAGAVEGTSEAGGDLVFETRADGGSLAEKLRITSSGNVGIGTTNPTSLLYLNKSNNSGVGPELVLNNSAGTYGDLMALTFSSSTIPRSGFVSGITVDGAGSGYLSIYTRNTSGIYGERVRINSSGNVGIGTANPASTLHVVGTLRSTGQTYLGIGETTTITYIGDPFTANTKSILFNRSSTITDFVNIQGLNAGVGYTSFTMQALGGNVGIGTTNPEDRLDLASGFIRFKEAIGGTGTYGGIRAYNSLVPSVSATAIRFIRDVAEVGNDGAICFDTTNNERVRISSTGNVGIGTANPGNKLHVYNGDLELSGGYNLSWGGSYSGGNPTIWGNASNKTIRFAPDGPTTGLVALLSSGGFTSDFVLLSSSNSHQIRSYTDALKYFDLQGYLGNASYNGTSIGFASRPGYGASLSLYLGGRQPILPSGWTGTIYYRGNANSGSLGTSVALQTSTDGDSWTTQAVTANTWDVVLSWTQSTAANVPIYVRFLLAQNSGGNVGEASCRISDIRITNLYARPFSFGLSNKLISQYNYQNTTLSSDPTHYQALFLSGSGAYASNNIGHGIGFYSTGVSSESLGTVVAAINSVDEGAQDAQGLSFCTANTTVGSLSEKLRISNSGNVGIGTANPSQKFQIYGSNSQYTSIISSSSGNTGVLFGDSDRVDSGFILYDNANNILNLGTGGSISGSGTTKISITSGGNVGIGITNPACLLDLTTTIASAYTDGGGSLNVPNGEILKIRNLDTPANNTAAFATFHARGNVGNMSIWYAGNTGGNATGFSGAFVIGNRSGDPQYTERLRISSSGNVGIGTTNPLRKLHVSGDILVKNVANGDGISAVMIGSSVFDGNLDTTGVSIRTYVESAGSNGYALQFFTSQNYLTGQSEKMRIAGNGAVTVYGSLSKGSGSFKIDHPLPEKTETHHLVHSFVESPQANNIYRGKITLTNGQATVNLDEVSGMTEGTFVLLNRDIHCFTSNETNWDNVKGSVTENILTIDCQNENSSATVSWLVIGERHDQHMYDTEWTDDDGKVIVEPLKNI